VYWSPERPAATFGEVFYVDFGDKVQAYLEEGPLDRQTFLATSLLSGRSKGLHVLSSPSSVAAITDGLKLSNYFEWNDDIASTGVAGACLQLLGGYRDLPDPPEKVLEALRRSSVSREDEPLLKFTTAILENPQQRHFSSEEILAETSLAGWKFWDGGNVMCRDSTAASVKQS